MTDIFLEWMADFEIDSTGDLLTADGDTEVRQRLERRLFTAVKGYIWHPDYGAGLPQKIGSVLSVEEILSVCRSQLNLEASVAPNPPAQLGVRSQPNGLVSIDIRYWDAKTGETVSFAITN